VGVGAQGIAITGGYAYVANRISWTVSVVNLTTKLVESTINVGNRPIGVAVSADGAYVYVTNPSDDLFNPGSVSVISTASKTVVATVTDGIGNQPRMMAAWTQP